MNAEHWSRWLSLAANLGLLGGLMLVAVQINQSSDLARAQLINDGNIAFNQIWSTVLGENPSVAVAKAIEHPEELTYADFVVVDAYFFTSLNLFYRNYELAREGLFEESDWKEALDTNATWWFGSEFARIWWEEEARHFFAAEFVEYVDQLIENVPESGTVDYWLRVKSRLAEGASKKRED